jgi:hypothetical protein
MQLKRTVITANSIQAVFPSESTNYDTEQRKEQYFASIILETTNNCSLKEIFL